jgi:DNA-binding CsgD family transcriptional regulator
MRYHDIAELDGLLVEAPERKDPGTGLSASERRVALLAAEGYTNREISARLFITISTVEQHLTRVYRKMAITSRARLSGRTDRLSPDQC